jgi:hypothetical protein
MNRTINHASHGFYYGTYPYDYTRVLPRQQTPSDFVGRYDD